MSLLSDRIDLLFQREAVKGGERQAQEQADSPLQQKECLPKSLLNLLGGSLHCGWIWDTPVCGHRLAWPDGTDFVRGVVTNGKNEIEPGSVRLRELVPTLAAKTSRRQVSRFELPQCRGTDHTCGPTTRAVSGEVRLAFLIHDGLSHDGARRVA